MGWEQLIGGCFGDVDQKFARHRNDEDRAFDLLARLRLARVGWSVVGPAFERYLESHVKHKLHIEEEMEQVGLHFKPWLDD